MENLPLEPGKAEPRFVWRALAAQVVGQAGIWLILLLFLGFVMVRDDVPLIARWFPQLRPSERTINQLALVLLGAIPPLSWMAGLFQRLVLRRWISHPAVWMLASVAAFWPLFFLGMQKLDWFDPLSLNPPLNPLFNFGFIFLFGHFPQTAETLQANALYQAALVIQQVMDGALIGMVYGLIYGAAQSCGLKRGFRWWTLTTSAFWLLLFAAINPLLIFLYNQLTFTGW